MEVVKGANAKEERQFLHITKDMEDDKQPMCIN